MKQLQQLVNYFILELHYFIGFLKRLKIQRFFEELIEFQNYSEKCLVLYLNNCHLFMYLDRMVQWDCVIKLHDNRIFTTLLRIKKSFMSIDLDLPKHPLEFVWKISNLKIKLSLLGTKSRKRLTRKRLQTAEERNTAENQGKTYPRKQTSS